MEEVGAGEGFGEGVVAADVDCVVAEARGLVRVRKAYFLSQLNH